MENLTSIISISSNEFYVFALTNSGAIYKKRITPYFSQEVNKWELFNEGDKLCTDIKT